MRRKTIAILLAVAMVASLCMTGSAMAKSKKQTYKALKSVSVKSYDKDKKKWGKDRTVTFKYNKKGDPTKIIDDGTVRKYIIVNKFNYKKGKKKSLVRKITTVKKNSDRDAEKATYKITYNKKGLPVKKTYKNFYIDDYVDVTMKYKYKNGFVTSTDINLADNSSIEKNAIKFKKGLPTKITKTGKYNGEPNWIKLYTATFNNKGLYKNITEELYETVKLNYKYTYKKGLVTKAENNIAEYYENTPEKFKKIYTFKYTKKKISKKNYARMINTYLRDDFDMFWY